MAYDSLTLARLTQELSSILVGGKINKVLQPERDEIILTVYNKNTYKLLISANATVNRIHLTEYVKENPLNAFNFCMLLRKHIVSGTISNVMQMPFERVVDFTIENKSELGYSETKHLIFELTSKTSNIILTNKDYVIIEMLKHLPNNLDAERFLLVGAKYDFFSKREKLLPTDSENIEKLIVSSQQSIDKLLMENLLGISTQTLAEMLFDINVDNHSLLNAQRVTDGINTYLNNLQHGQANIAFLQNNAYDAYPFDYKSSPKQKQFYPSLNKAHDAFFELKDHQLRFSQKSKSLHSLLKNSIGRFEKKIALQAQAVLDSSQSEYYKICGDLILSNVYQIKHNQSKLVCQNFYSALNEEIAIDLDASKTAQQNAQEYYKKYKKQKNTLLFSEKLLAENRATLEYLKGVFTFLKLCDKPQELAEITMELQQNGIIKEKANAKQKQQPLTAKPLKYNIDGFSVYVGRNNFQNDYVTFKLAKPDDIWVHAHGFHSAHAVIIANGKVVPDCVTNTCAELVLFYSEAKLADKAEVDYTLKKNIKKPPKAKLGYVIYNTYSTLLAKPCQHADLIELA